MCSVDRDETERGQIPVSMTSGLHTQSNMSVFVVFELQVTDDSARIPEPERVRARRLEEFFAGIPLD
jgi:hypothetical protein